MTTIDPRVERLRLALKEAVAEHLRSNPLLPGWAAQSDADLTSLAREMEMLRERNRKLEEALLEARPYVLQPIVRVHRLARRDVARDILGRVDAALAEQEAGE